MTPLLVGSVMEVGQRLREDDVGFLHEHDGFTETLPLADDLDDFLAALG